jgi:hypothetical protein
MTTRTCCACKLEPSDGAPVRFPLLRIAYPLGAECRAAWRQEAQALGGAIYNPAKVQVAFRNWLEARTKNTAATKPEPRPEGWWRAVLAEGLRLARGWR